MADGQVPPTLRDDEGEKVEKIQLLGANGAPIDFSFDIEVTGAKIQAAGGAMLDTTTAALNLKANRSLDNVTNADFLAKGQAAGMASDAELNTVQTESHAYTDAAIANIGATGAPYPDVATGLAATTEGKTFLVQGSGDQFALLYQKTGGVAVNTGRSLVDASAVAKLRLPPLKILAALGGDVARVNTLVKGSATPDAETFPAAGTFGHQHPDAFAADSILSRVKVRVATAGTARLATINLEYQVVTWTADVALVAGVNDLSAGSAFPIRKVAKDEVLIYYATSGASLREGVDGTAPGNKYFVKAAAPTVGEHFNYTNSLIPWAHQYALEYELIGVTDFVNPAPVIQNYSPVSFTKFGITVPAGWTFVGGNFSMSDGLIATGVGTWTGNYAQYVNVTASKSQTQSCQFVLEGADNSFAFGTKNGAALSGGAVQINRTTNKMGLYSSWQTQQVLVTEVTIPSMVNGDWYTCEAAVEQSTITVKLFDKVGVVLAQFSTPHFASNDTAAFVGHPTFWQFAGTTKFRWHQHRHNTPARIKGAFIGDSNMAAYSTLVPLSWAMMLAKYRGKKDIFVSANSGDINQWAAERLAADWDPIRSAEYVALALGSNYSTLSVWESDVQANIDRILAKGAEPVLCSQVPRDTAQSLMNSMNDRILGKYFGDYRVLDIAVPISVDGQRLAWAAGLTANDGIHAANYGQQKIFEYVRDNYPWTWQDSPYSIVGLQR